MSNLFQFLSRSIICKSSKIFEEFDERDTLVCAKKLPASSFWE